jgi:hypothetical protein
MLFILASCGGQNDAQKQRVKELGLAIYDFVQKGEYKAPWPDDVVFLGNQTFWNILEISEPLDATNIYVHDGAGLDEKADYLLDFGTHLGLRIKYDQERDQFHILGYQAAITKIEDQTYLQIRSDLSQELYEVGDIQPGIGLDGMQINSSSKQDIFSVYTEEVYNDLEVWFDFENDTLITLYISRYQLNTAEDIHPGTANKNDIISLYGEPIKTKKTIHFLNKDIKNVEVLVYPGIEFVMLADELMVIIVNE